VPAGTDLTASWLLKVVCEDAVALMPARWIFSVVAAVVVAGTVVFFAFSRHREIPPVEPGQAAFDPALVAKGAELARIGNCNTCHTKQDGAPYAGGRPIATPFGTIYATNITPDPESGIGRWSHAAFARAMSEGIRRDGAQLYPAFPYDHFTKLSADDVRAIYAFLMTRDLVRADIPENDLSFPFNIRTMVAGWKLLFFERGEFQPDHAQGTEWNRGAYLVEALAHCGACHTPRNVLGAQKRGRSFAGGETEGWIAPALDATSTAPVAWNTEQLAHYLRHGFVEPHGVAAGPMQDVVNNLNGASAEDVHAMAAYISAMLGPATADRQGNMDRASAGSPTTRGPQTTGSAPTKPALQDAVNATGSVIYAGACASCHERTGQSFSAQGIPLTASKVLTLPDPQNLIHIIREGIAPPEGAPAATMPGFANALTDEQVVVLVNFLRSNFTNQGQWRDVDGFVRRIREAKGE
jgi:mono/diheme cytochrome c family protein